MEDTRLPKCVMFRELIGYAGCVGGKEKSEWGDVCSALGHAPLHLVAVHPTLRRTPPLVPHGVPPYCASACTLHPTLRPFLPSCTAAYPPTPVLRLTPL